jgi:alpha-N-acetylglucosaminidase
MNKRSCVMWRLWLVFCVFVVSFVAGQSHAGVPVPLEHPIWQVLARTIPDQQQSFILETIPQMAGKDVFEIDARNSKIVLAGNNGIAICSALNWYLKYYCHADLSWSGAPIKLGDPLPQAHVRLISPYRYRYFFNYCCFGYSLAWWDWPQWEKLIDWMAMNGVNMPLAVTGSEAIWRQVLLDLGLSEKSVADFLAGPPYLPFGWMGCLDGWGGPLPGRWLDRHLELQKKILQRQRELGMTPVLQGFTGHVPAAIQEKFPQAKLQKIRWVDWNTYFLDPQDPLFKRIGSSFLEHQFREFGTDHLYAADTFIEMTPPSSDPEFLRSMGKAISDAMTAVDDKAVWVMQGWVFFNNAKFWQPPQAEAILRSVPDERMLLLDLFCDENPVWNKTNAFYGKPWVWCVLQNFGNTVRLHGQLKKINKELFEAAANPQRGQLCGIGMIQEGLDYNPVVFDFMTEMAWHDRPVDLEHWIREYSARRYGQSLAAAEQAWQILLDTVYSGAGNMAPALPFRPSLELKRPTTHLVQTCETAKAWQLLLRCSTPLANTDTYRFDLVNISRQVLVSYSTVLFNKIVAAYKTKDARRIEELSKQLNVLALDLDELLATRQEFLLGAWLEDAKRWGDTAEEERRCEWNARNVLTLWGNRDCELHDYARKEWSGLISSFYLPRWQQFCTRLATSICSGQSFDGAAFEQDIRKWEEHWTLQNGAFPAQPSGNAVAISSRLYDKYVPLVLQAQAGQ